jgi:flagellar motor component MotA
MPIAPLCTTDPAQLVMTFLRMTTIARNDDVLSLEEHARHAESTDAFVGPFLRAALSMVVDGVDRELIVSTLTDYADAEVSAIRQVLDLVIAGAVSVHDGMHAHLMADVLSASLSPTDKQRLADRLRLAEEAAAARAADRT